MQAATHKPTTDKLLAAGPLHAWRQEDTRQSIIERIPGAEVYDIITLDDV